VREELRNEDRLDILCLCKGRGSREVDMAKDVGGGHGALR
jgi:hypothetical protein